MGDDIQIRMCTQADIKLADYVLKHPEVYNMYQWDGRCERERYSSSLRINQGPPTYVLIDNTNSFVAILVQESNIVWSSHSNALPSIRGKQAIRICKAMVRWMFDNTPCRKIIGFTPDSHKAALMFNKLCGFKTEAVINDFFLKDGKHEKAHMVSITKE